ncbi:3-hydroxylacyl-ACP dehydratase [Rheinheimera sp.]|uniref:ApeP family dehydratase n=1 Tax=Rheinheimera sp. TaxID=1869214 RepID=UPI0027BAFC1B|nr:3-hydroxylacyl-ACP dehydratase [Rheinheimera sp.]
MISGYALEQLLPHDHPMILLSRFIVADENSVQTEVEISSSSPFFQDVLQAVPAYVGLEYMAQTIACYAGANALLNGNEVKIGFLLGCRKYAPAVSQFALGTKLQLKAEKVVSEDTGLSVFLCEISANGFVLVQANLNVFQPENHLDWLKEF